MITLLAGGERSANAGRHHLKNTITLSNNGTNMQWTNSLSYICATEQCNSLATLKRLLRSLKSHDIFSRLVSLLQINAQFNGGLCSFFANSSVYCETEMDPSTCRQCATQEYTKSQSVEVCSNCVADTIIENFVTREVNFYMDDRKRHDLWMIECQTENCNAVETGDLIRQNSHIDFDFDVFLNSASQVANWSLFYRIALAFMLTIVQIVR